MNKLGTKLGAIAMSAVMALTFAPSAAITSLAASGDGLTDATLGLKAVHSVYNPNTGEHLFTISEAEVDYLVNTVTGWKDEGVKWKAPSSSTVPVYRVYNPNNGDHHYTTSLTERAFNLENGWVNDNNGNPVFYGADRSGAIQVYRLYNSHAATGTHHYTTDLGEYNWNVSLGWTGEGSRFWGYSKDYEPEKPVEELTVKIDNTTPKVGDTIKAILTPAGADAVLEWALADSADGPWTTIDEKDASLLVTEDMLGKFIQVKAYKEDKTSVSDTTKKAVADIDATGNIEIVSLEAVSANEIEVTFADTVVTANYDVTLKRGDTAIEHTQTWNPDGFKSLTLKGAANFVEGTYTVTATNKTDETDTDSATVDIKKQEVSKIVINPGAELVALTKKGNDPAAKQTAYAYYDVIDQYGNSMRNSTSITWAGSCKIQAKKSTGLLTLTKTTATDWIYGEQIFITGVNPKTGDAVNETLTVGTEQALDHVAIEGFIRKNTNKLLKTLPKGFKEGEYYAVFKSYDKNGFELNATDIEETDVAFVSMSPMVIESVKNLSTSAMTDENGNEYRGVAVKPGIDVAQGGEVTVQAIATRTGTTKDYPFIVGLDQVVQSFTIEGPEDIVADGDTDVKINFTAKDVDGNEITNFVTLAKQKTFNTLQLTASAGSITLKEADDGTAELLWSDDGTVGGAVPTFMAKTATDGIARPVNLTAVVVGGESDYEMFNVEDKRRPDAIIDVDLDDAYTEGAVFKLTLDSFAFVDQYGKPMQKAGKFYSNSTAADPFFGVQHGGSIDFNGYTFYVKADYTGNNKGLIGTADGITYTENAASLLNAGNKDAWVLGATAAAPIYTTKSITGAAAYSSFKTSMKVDKALTGEGFKFEIVKHKNGDAVNDIDKYDSTSPTFTKTFDIVDISQVRNFTMGSLNMFYAGAFNETGDGMIEQGKLADLQKEGNAAETTIKVTNVVPPVKGLNSLNGAYDQEVTVTGKYNGKDVKIPKEFIRVWANKVKATDEVADVPATDSAPAVPGMAGTEFSNLGQNKINDIIIYKDGSEMDGGLNIRDLYDKTSSTGVSQIAKDTVKVMIYKIYSGEGIDLNGEYYTVSGNGAVKNKISDIATVAAWNAATTSAAKDALLPVAEVDIRTAITNANTALRGALTTGSAEEKAAKVKGLKANLEAYGTLGTAFMGIHDTTSQAITISDQAPYAAKFDGFKDSYTFNQTHTGYDETNLEADLADVDVLDQYDISMGYGIEDLFKKASDITENEDRYVVGNLSVSGNDTVTLDISGAELGDTFTLTLRIDKLSQDAKVTMGADNEAFISGNGNVYRDRLVEGADGLEDQRATIFGL